MEDVLFLQVGTGSFGAPGENNGVITHDPVLVPIRRVSGIAVHDVLRLEPAAAQIIQDRKENRYGVGAAGCSVLSGILHLVDLH